MLLTQAEDGCIDYRYSADLGEPNRINIVEAWESDYAMNAHMGAAHPGDFMVAIGDCIGGPVEATRDYVATSTKLF